MARTAGDLRTQILEALNVGVGKTEDLEEIRDLGKTGDLERRGGPEKKGGGLFSGVKDFDLGAPSLM